LCPQSIGTCSFPAVCRQEFVVVPYIQFGLYLVWRIPEARPHSDHPQKVVVSAVVEDFCRTISFHPENFFPSRQVPKRVAHDHHTCPPSCAVPTNIQYSSADDVETMLCKRLQAQEAIDAVRLLEDSAAFSGIHDFGFNQCQDSIHRLHCRLVIHQPGQCRCLNVELRVKSVDDLNANKSESVL
jgi:hypothetical protein